jgi:small conductance mechanosensitive channel
MNLLQKIKEYLALIIFIIGLMIAFSAYPKFMRLIDEIPNFSTPPSISIDSANPFTKFSVPLNRLSGEFGYISFAPVLLNGSPIFDVGGPIINSPDPKQRIKTPLIQRVEYFENNFRNIIRKGFDPNTLQVAIATLNGDSVITVSDKNTPIPKIIGTITKSDAEIYGETIEQTSKREVDLIYEALIKSSQEHHTSNLKPKIILLSELLILTISCCYLFIKISFILQARRKEIKDILFTANKEENTYARKGRLTTLINYLFDCLTYIPVYFKYRYHTNKKLYISIRKFIANPKYFLTKSQYDNILRKQIKFEIFIERFWIISIFMWIYACIHLSLFIFPDTRSIGVRLNGIPDQIIEIWLISIVVINLIDHALDWTVEIWANRFIYEQKLFERKLTHMTILMRTLKIFILLSVIFTALFLSLNACNVPVETILASASILGFVISFGCQNLIKDVIASAVNLMHDSYAINDFITIDSYSGYVENFTLLATQIRCENGNLVTIPSSLVGKVCNHSKEYSLVDLELKISSKENINHVFDVLDQITRSIYEDTQWSTLVLESNAEKSIHNISNDSVILKILLKVSPHREKLVSSYLRLKIKEEFIKTEIEFA